MKGGFSGGTVDSAPLQVDGLKEDAGARRIVGDPWALADGPRPTRTPNGAGGTGGTASGRPFFPAGVLDRLVKASPVRRDADNGHFTGPFVMAMFNHPGRGALGVAARLRRRLPATSSTPTTARARPVRSPRALTSSVALGVGLAGLAVSLRAGAVDRVLPKPGEGPSVEVQASGSYRMEVTGEATDGARYRTTVAAPYDPGYGGPAVIFGQAALALVEDRDRLPDAAGVLLATATAFRSSTGCARSASRSRRRACPADPGRDPPRR